MNWSAITNANNPQNGQSYTTLNAKTTHPFLKSKFQVGSGKSDKINYTQPEKVFHVGDVP